MDVPDAPTRVKLRCRLFGHGVVFSVEMGRREVAGALVAHILNTPEVNWRQVHVYLAMDENGNWLLDTVNVAAVHGAIPDVCQELTDGLLISSVEELFGRFGVAADNTIQLLVRLRQEPSTANPTLPPAAQQRRGGDGDVRFASLWNYPPFPTDQPNLPEPDDLGGFLQVGRNPTNLFAEGARPIVCGDLLARIDTFLGSCVAGLPETSSEERWHLFYDQLIELSVHICRAKGMDIYFVRNEADPTGTTFGTLRPDALVICGGIPLLRVEEKRARKKISKPLAELTDKMVPWQSTYYGDLPYILGYASSGAQMQFVAIDTNLSRTTLVSFSVFNNGGADAIKAFYNLAFLFDWMMTASKQALPATWFSRHPSATGKERGRTIKVVQDSMKRVIKQSWVEKENYSRLKGVYRTLVGITPAPGGHTHLQEVRRLEIQRWRRKLIVRLGPLGYHRLPETETELSEWLRGMLIALNNWHSRGYCHGDLRWRNVVYVPDDGGYWILIDMDKSHKPGAPITWEHPCNDRKLKCKHDLYQLGTLLDVAVSRVALTGGPEGARIRQIQELLNGLSTVLDDDDTDDTVDRAESPGADWYLALLVPDMPRTTRVVNLTAL